MKINANFHAINKYCMKNQLFPNSDLAYWLQFGFPKELKTIDIEKYTSKSTFSKPIKQPKTKKKKKILYLDSFLPFGKYKHSTVERIIDINPNYIKWFINIWDGIVSDEVSKALK